MYKELEDTLTQMPHPMQVTSEIREEADCLVTVTHSFPLADVRE